MDPAPRDGAVPSTVIFRDNALWLIHHPSRQCQTLDEQGIEELAEKVGAAMKQMEAQMAQMPPEQREAMMGMMKGRIPPGMEAMMGMGQEPEPRRVDKGEARVELGSFSCTEFTHYTGDHKDWEICAAPAGDLEGAAIAVEAFQKMAELAGKIRDAFPGGPLANRVDDPLQFVDQVDGFPVRVRAYRMGRLTRETTLKSMTPKELDEDVFAVPDGYEVVNLTDQLRDGIRGGGR
jgi:hypothetical protein